MNSLNLGSDNEPVIKKKSSTRNLKIALGLAAIILIPTIGSTLAGTITVGTSNNVEFGQGVATTVSCQSTAINVQPTTVLSSGVFYLDTIVVSNIETGCTANYFTFRVVNGSATTLEISSDGVFGCKIAFVTASSASTGTAGCVLSSKTTTGFTITPSVRTIAASSVAKVTVETSTA